MEGSLTEDKDYIITKGIYIYFATLLLKPLK
ncbi:uncharacterized protein FTOL_12431 [Fusarium torulosum]|uniref:Uncharacterized protein n=1 Tax=Fusarium torulosum TaxID=33205 RepID=A0AAE8MKH0_9HYPO|nr:uncharacterized protein FTOL_12431 [Fusarium torulosum]